MDLEQRLTAFHEGYGQFHQKFPDVFLVELDTLLRLGQVTNHPEVEYEAHLRRGGLLNYRGQHDLALEAYDKAQEVATALGDSVRMGTVESNRGNAHVAKKQYIKSIEHFSNAVKYHRASGDSMRILNDQMALGAVYALLDDHALAKVYYQQVADELPKSEEHEYFKALLNVNLGWSDYKLSDFETASELTLNALDTFRKYNSQFHVAGCLTNLATIYLDSGSIALAAAYADSGKATCEAIGDIEQLLTCALIRAEIEQKTGRPEKALMLIDRIEHELQIPEDFEFLEHWHRIRSRALKEIGKTEEALAEHEKFHLYHDSVMAQTNSFAIARSVYAKDKEHTVHMLKMDSQRKRDRQRLSQLQTVLGLTVGFVLVVSLLIIFIFRSRASQEKKRQHLLDEIQGLKSAGRHMAIPTFESLNRDQLEKSLGRRLNDTDWNVLNLLLDNPTITNAKLAERACLSVDGIGSSLRRMYAYFKITDTKYKKIALLHAAVTLSKKSAQNHPQA